MTKDNITLVGTCILYKNGVEIKREKNLVVNSGLNNIMALLNGELAVSIPSYIGVGSSNAATAPGQLTLQGTEFGRLPFSSKIRDMNKITYVARFDPGVGTGIWEECGVFGAASGGVMFSRSLTGTYTKNALDTIEVHWVYELKDSSQVGD